MAGKHRKHSRLTLYILIALFILWLFSPEGKSLLREAKNEIYSLFGRSAETVLTGDDLVGVDFIDVGQGDSTLISTPQGKYILVDASTAKQGAAVDSHLERQGVTEIEYFILTHPHADHIGGAAQIFDGYDVKAVIMPDVATNSATYTRLLDRIAKEKEETGCRVIRAVPGKSYTVDGCTLDIFPPAETEEDDLNNASVVAKLSYGDFSLLLTGDAEKKSEQLILDGGFDLSSTALKVPHHGSSTSLGREYLAKISPELAVISCEEGNSYGHPHEETISLLEEFGITTYITKDNGTVSLLTDGRNYTVKCMR